MTRLRGLLALLVFAAVALVWLGPATAHQDGRRPAADPGPAGLVAAVVPAVARGRTADVADPGHLPAHARHWAGRDGAAEVPPAALIPVGALLLAAGAGPVTAVVRSRRAGLALGRAPPRGRALGPV